MVIQKDTNYLINTTCPHCKAKLVAAVSGFAAEMAVRIKTCPKCGKDYYLTILASASTTKQTSDGDIPTLRQRIKWLKEQREKDHARLLQESMMYEQIYRDALEMAKEMYHKRQLN